MKVEKWILPSLVYEAKNRLKVLDPHRLHYYGLFLKKKKQGHSNLHTLHVDAKKNKEYIVRIAAREIQTRLRRKSFLPVKTMNH